MARDLVDKLLTRCLDQPASEWHEHVDGLCHEHPDLAFEVRRRFARLVEFGIIDVGSANEEHRGPERLGHFRLLRRVAGGGMGVVYEAHDEKLDRRVALKVIRRDHAFFAGSRERFDREVLAASRLDHPNICPVYEADEIDGVPYLAMRFVDGPSLAQMIEERRSSRGNVARGTTSGSDSRSADQVALVEKLARALHAAHEVGLVHRDVKPGNVLIDRDGEPVLVDFGLARDTDSDLPVLTRTGERLGTPAYMAPEQVAGREVDRRADVYGLGALLYECLTLRCPFVSQSREDLYQQILAEPPTPPRTLDRGISQELCVVLEKALQKRPADRFATAEEFAEELRRIRTHEPIRSRRPGLPLRALRWSQRHPAAAIGLAGLTVALAVTTGFLLQLRASYRATRAAGLAQAAANEGRRDQRLALALAREAWALQRTPETFAQLHESLFEYREVGRYRPHDAAIASVRLSADGTRILTASRDHTAAVWDAATWKLVARFEHLGAVNLAEFDPADGDRILTACQDGRAYVWRVGERRSLRSFTIDETNNGCTHAAWSSSGRRIAACSIGRHVAVWEADSDREEPLWRHETEAEVHCVAFAPTSESRLLTTGVGGRIRVWDTNRSDGRPALAPEYSGWQLNNCAWSADGTFFVTTGNDNSAVLWTAEGERLDTLPDHGAPVQSLALSPDARSRWVATGSRDQVLRVFDRLTGTLAFALRGHTSTVLSVAFSPDGRRLLSADQDGVVRVWELNPAASGVIDFRDHPAGVWCAVPHPSDGRVFSGGEQWHVVAWDPRSGAVLERFAGDIGNLGFFANGDRVMLTRRHGNSDTAEILATATGEILDRVPGIEMRWAALAPDETIVAGISGDNVTSAFDLRSRKVLWEHAGTGGPPTGMHADLAFSPRDPHLLVTAAQAAAVLREVATGTEVQRFVGHRDFVTALAFSPRGDVLLTGSRDRTARLWDVDTGAPIAVYPHRAPITAVAFALDGTRFATGDMHGGILVRSLDGQRTTPLRGHRGTIRSLAFMEVDGRTRLLSASTDGSCRTWIVDEDELIDTVNRRLHGQRFERSQLEPYASLLGDRLEALVVGSGTPGR